MWHKHGRVEADMAQAPCLLGKLVHRIHQVELYFSFL